MLPTQILTTRELTIPLIACPNLKTALLTWGIRFRILRSCCCPFVPKPCSIIVSKTSPIDFLSLRRFATSSPVGSSLLKIVSLLKLSTKVSSKGLRVISSTGVSILAGKEASKNRFDYTSNKLKRNIFALSQSHI